MSCCFDGDPWELYCEIFRRARRSYRCCECGAQINPGDEYQHIAGKLEGTFYRDHTCEKCADLRDALAEVTCPELGGLYECYRYYLDDVVRYDEGTDSYTYPENHIMRRDGQPR